MGRSIACVLLPAILVWSRSGAFSSVCKADSKNDNRCEEPDNGPVELLTSTRRVR